MKTLIRTSLSVALLSAAFASCDVAHGAAGLELSPAVGQKARFELTMHQEISQSVMGQEQNQEQTFVYGFTQTLGERGADGVLEIDVVYDWVSVELMLPAPTGRVAFDSRESEADPGPLVAGFAAIVGKGFRMRVTPTGDILAVDGVTEMIEAMFTELELPAEAVVMRDAMKKQFGDAAMKEFMQGFVAIYPDRDVVVGDTWVRRHEVTSIYPHVQENTYELLERADGVCKLRLESQVLAQEGGAPMDMGTVKFNISMSGTQSGILTLDEATGMVRESRVESDLSGEMQLVDEDMEPWPMSIQQELILRAVD